VISLQSFALKRRKELQPIQAVDRCLSYHMACYQLVCIRGSCPDGRHNPGMTKHARTGSASPGNRDACPDGTKVRSNDAAAVLASMRKDSLKLAAAAASGSGELLSQSPVQSGTGVIAVGAPRLACQAPQLTLTQRWQVMAAYVSCLRCRYLLCMHPYPRLFKRYICQYEQMSRVGLHQIPAMYRYVLLRIMAALRFNQHQLTICRTTP